MKKNSMQQFPGHSLLKTRGETLSEQCITFAYVTTLSQMTVISGTFDPAFCFLSGQGAQVEAPTLDPQHQQRDIVDMS